MAGRSGASLLWPLIEGDARLRGDVSQVFDHRHDEGNALRAAHGLGRVIHASIVNYQDLEIEFGRA